MAPSALHSAPSMPPALGGAHLPREQSWSEPGLFAPALRRAGPGNWSSSPAGIHGGAENLPQLSHAPSLQHAASQLQLNGARKQRVNALNTRASQVTGAGRPRAMTASSAGSLGYGARGRSSGALNDITNVNSQVGAFKAKKERNSLKAASQPTAADEYTEQQPVPPALPASAAVTPPAPHQIVPVGSPQCVAEYASEIFCSLFREEMLFMHRSNYMDQQTDINAKMRAILIDWLIEVAMKYRLRTETLYLTINIIDRYLSRMPVLRKKLQLLGVVAMFIAAKFEEIDPPRVSDFVYITDNTYTKDEIFEWECQVLTTLDFRIVVPTQAHFLDTLAKANRCEECHAKLAQYILELALLDYRLICYSPSHLVAAALLLSNSLLGRRPVWPASMVQATRHAEHVLQACAEDMRAILEAAPTAQLQAVRKKYSLPAHRRVSQMDFSTVSI